MRFRSGEFDHPLHEVVEECALIGPFQTPGVGPEDAEQWMIGLVPVRAEWVLALRRWECVGVGQLAKIDEVGMQGVQHEGFELRGMVGGDRGVWCLADCAADRKRQAAACIPSVGDARNQIPLLLGEVGSW